MYGSMGIWSSSPKLHFTMSPQGPSTQSQRVQKIMLRIPLFFCSAKPCLAVRQMENSHGNGVEQRILADKRSSCITHTKPIKRSNQSQTAKFSRTCLDYKYHAKQLNQQNDQRTSQHHFNGLRWPVVDTQ